MNPAEKLYHYSAHVLRVVDGDTLEVMIDHGDSIFRKRTIRILGMNAPEMTGKAKDAGHGARNVLILHLAIHGNAIIIRTEKPDSFGRSLAECWTLDGKSVAEYMIEQGRAVPTNAAGKPLMP
jgi:micrococcal nuclease